MATSGLPTPGVLKTFEDRVTFQAMLNFKELQPFPILCNPFNIFQHLSISSLRPELLQAHDVPIVAALCCFALENQTPIELGELGELKGGQQKLRG